MELEDIKTQIQLVAGVMSKFFIDLETFLNEENAKKENGEEYDEYVVNNAKLAQMHASHSIAEAFLPSAAIFAGTFAFFFGFSSASRTSISFFMLTMLF